VHFVAPDWSQIFVAKQVEGEGAQNIAAVATSSVPSVLQTMSLVVLSEARRMVSAFVDPVAVAAL
jgi:hypothetical protein